MFSAMRRAPPRIGCRSSPSRSERGERQTPATLPLAPRQRGKGKLGATLPLAPRERREAKHGATLPRPASGENGNTCHVAPRLESGKGKTRPRYRLAPREKHSATLPSPSGEREKRNTARRCPSPRESGKGKHGATLPPRAASAGKGEHLPRCPSPRESGERVAEGRVRGNNDAAHIRWDSSPFCACPERSRRTAPNESALGFHAF